MDQGIIQNLKFHYRKRLLRRRIAAIDSGREFTLNLLDAVFLLRQAWNEVTEATLSNCFRKAGFVFNELVIFQCFDINFDEFQDEVQNEDVEDQELGNYWTELQRQSEFNADVEISDYLAVDDAVITSGSLTLEEIAQEHSSSTANEVNSDDEEIQEVEERIPITGPAARQAYFQLRQFCEENGLNEKLYTAFDQVEEFLLKDQMSKMKQPMISDFFVHQ